MTSKEMRNLDIIASRKYIHQIYQLQQECITNWHQNENIGVFCADLNNRLLELIWCDFTAGGGTISCLNDFKVKWNNRDDWTTDIAVARRRIFEHVMTSHDVYDAYILLNYQCNAQADLLTWNWTTMADIDYSQVGCVPTSDVLHKSLLLITFTTANNCFIPKTGLNFSFNLSDGDTYVLNKNNWGENFDQNIP